MRRILVLVLVVACGDNKTAQVGQDAAPDSPTYKCGDGVVDENEDCDDGQDNGGQGKPCTTSCHWVCDRDEVCADADPCNGEEKCVDHACVVGTALDDGVTCGTGKLCRNASCTDSVCGDSYTTAPEECDDSNSTNGDGCDGTCKYSCVSTDVTRNCALADPCKGTSTCNDTSHTCSTPTPLADNTACTTATITNGYCKTTTCTQAVCGNGTLEPGEVCDEGTANGTANSGCKANCTYVCVNATTDCPAAPACQKQACSATHTCDPVADPTKDGTSCGTNMECNAGACVALTAVCGNGVVESGEQCDLGTGFNGAGTGCELNCQFSCTILPDSCNDGNPCNGVETCTMVTVNAKPGQKCTSTAAPATGTACATGKICFNQVCVTSICGDTYVDAGLGETCEPPNTATCDAVCHTIVCGDSVRAGTEQCDDGNATNLDGCDATCKFEQCHRVNSLSMPFVTDAYCTTNALGLAIRGTLARNAITDALAGGVTSGSITIELKAVGLDDLSGTNDPNVGLGVLNGTPATGTTTYNGNSDLDWWYLTSSTVIDTNRTPKTVVPGSIAAKVLNAGPAEIKITVSLAGVPADLNMLNAKLRTNVGASSTPLVSTGGTPGHLASEHLDPALTSFATTTGGQLCGNVTAGSLDAVAAPSALSNCGYGATTHTLLDAVVNGCSVIFVGEQIRATQPDTSRSGSDTYLFTSNSSRQVTGCTKNGAAGNLTECLANAAYSSSFRFTTDRVIAK